MILNYLSVNFIFLLSYILSFRFFRVADSPANIQAWFIGLIVLVILSLIMGVRVKRSQRSQRSQRLKACAINLLVVLTVSFFVSRFTAFSLGYSYDIATSSSNEPTIEIGDITVSRHFDLTLKKGAFVGFNTGNYGVLRKRIVGEPFDQVTVCNCRVYVNEVVVGRSSATNKNQHINVCQFANLSFTLKAQEYFMLGDNYNNSVDSRIFGAVKLADIMAVSLYKISPDGKVTTL